MAEQGEMSLSWHCAYFLQRSAIEHARVRRTLEAADQDATAAVPLDAGAAEPAHSTDQQSAAQRRKEALHKRAVRLWNEWMALAPQETVGEEVRDTPAYVRCVAALERILGAKELWFDKSSAEMREDFRSVSGNI